MNYYKKELISNRLALPNGRGVKFEQIGTSDTGVLATADPGLIAELDKAVASNRGGVVALTQQQYDELKKNPPAERSRIRSLNAQSIQQILRHQKPVRNGEDVAAVKNEPSAPMEVPKGLVTVSSRRKMKELNARQEAKAKSELALASAQ